MLERRKTARSVHCCVVIMRGVKGRYDTFIWPSPSPPPNLNREFVEQAPWLDRPTKIDLISILGKRIFVLDYCITQFNGDSPGVWQMVEAGGV